MKNYLEVVGAFKVTMYWLWKQLHIQAFEQGKQL